MHRSMIRVLLAAGVAVGGLVWTDAMAAGGKEISATIDPGKCDKTWGPPCFTPANGTVTQIQQGETVTWHSTDGTHTVTPVDPSAFDGSGDLTGPDGTFSVTFDKPGTFAFYCKHHGSVDSDGKTHHGMWGKIEVKGAETTTTTAPPPPPSSPPPSSPPGTSPPPGPPPPTNPTHPPPSTSPPPTTSNGSTGSNGNNGQTAAGTGRPWVGPAPTQPPAPPPTRIAASEPPTTEAPKAKDTKDKKDDDASSPEATAPPPDAAVLPPSPEFPTPTTAPLTNPSPDVLHGDSVAVLKNEQGGRRRKLVMFGTVLGVGLFAAGVGGWKFTHRSSKYWPA